MPEPDFELIAQRLLTQVLWAEDSKKEATLAEQLRQIWNARGAADLATIDLLAAQWGDDGAHGSELLAACAQLRSLDR